MRFTKIITDYSIAGRKRVSNIDETMHSRMDQVKFVEDSL